MLLEGITSYNAKPFWSFVISREKRILELSYVCMYVYSLASISGESHIEHIN